MNGRAFWWNSQHWRKRNKSVRKTPGARKQGPLEPRGAGEEDRELIARMTEEIGKLFPRCPPREAAAIAAHTATRNSGRVGRTLMGWNLDEGPLTAGMDRLLARQQIADRVQAILAAWTE
jgi:hypothetical protein